MKDRVKRVSKFMSFVLRHEPGAIGIELDPNGWVAVDDLLAGMEREGRGIDADLLDRVVYENDKQRFEFSDDRTRIRARQGHSVEVDLAYEPTTPPDVLYHGTATRKLDLLLGEGLKKMARHHVHLSTNRETMLAVGKRYGRPVILAVDARQMHADGYVFFVTGNEVWLTEEVPPKYLSVSE